MEWDRKMEYIYFINERKLKEKRDIENNKPTGKNQIDIPTNTMPEEIESFTSGKITTEQFLEIKARKKKIKREKKKNTENKKEDII